MKTSCIDSLWRVITRECLRFYSDRVLLLLVFAMPVVLFTMFCSIYNKGIVRGLPVAVCDNDNTETSRLLIRAIQSSSSMRLTASLSSAAELERNIKRGTFAGGFYFPQGMEQDLKRGHSVHPVVYKNSQNILIGNYILKESQSIFRTFNAGVILKKFKKAGLSTQQALALVNQITTDVCVLYNPNFNYTQYMCPGLIFAQFQVIIMLCGLLVIAHEREQNTLQLALDNAGGCIGIFLLGKSIPYLSAFCAVALGILGILFPAFDIKIAGGFWETFVLVLLFVFASFAPGLMLGCLVKDPIVGTQVAIFINLPAFIFSGYTFPSGAFPNALALIAYVLPFTHFSSAFFKMSLVHAPLHYATNEIIALLGFVTIPLVLTWPFIAMQTTRRNAKALV